MIMTEIGEQLGIVRIELLGAIDLFVIWQLMVLAIGVAVLCGKPTGPIVTIFYTLYAVIAVVIAFVFLG